MLAVAGSGLIGDRRTHGVVWVLARDLQHKHPLQHRLEAGKDEEFSFRYYGRGI